MVNPAITFLPIAFDNRSTITWRASASTSRATVTPARTRFIFTSTSVWYSSAIAPSSMVRPRRITAAMNSENGRG